MTRTDVLNDIIRMHKYSSYLEIGILNKKRNYNSIRCPIKQGVDPALHSDSDGIHGVTSDVFFQDCKNTFDLIFIDGDHTFNQCAKDVNNALMALNPGGCIVMHDCLPETPLEAARVKPDKFYAWCGGAYAVYMLALTQLDKKECCVINLDHGLAILKPKAPAYLLIDHYSEWDEYRECRENGHMNIIERWSYENGCRLLLR